MPNTAKKTAAKKPAAKKTAAKKAAAKSLTLSRHTVPAELNDAGRAFWLDVTSKYELRSDELRTLKAACVALDLEKRITDAWEEDGSPMTSRGSMGQLVEHPMIGMADKQRKSFELFVKRLALPDDAPGVKPNQQREAGQSRWTAAHGNAG